MTTNRRRFLMGLACGAVLPRAMSAEAWPDRSVHVIVGSSAGGGADTVARLFARAMYEPLGQSLVIENRGGASGMIASNLVVHERPDGYTVLYDTFASVINSIAHKLSYDFEKDLRPVSQAVNAPSVMLVSTKSPYKSVQEFVAAARARPGKMTYASGGIGGVAHFCGEMLMKYEGVKLIHVPYKGGAPAVVDLLGGRVDTYFGNISSAIGYIRQGKLRPLAVTSNERLSVLPKIPSFVELGFPEFVISDWNGFFLPGKTPEGIVQRLSKAVQQVAREKPILERLDTLGLGAVGSTPEEFRTFLADQAKRWAALIKSNNIVLK
ncbi:Bug family tripartite tricarboxylate transporter substrate binding protein [Candidimonas nitroreducens]|uniref:LacI family transcriptional regulator n=1 Tax=Candidimonas nitroreducens TaxID=683354 RepID=A0A225MXG2_9BURK|nr:tripartite tricarboxylate transporter substrate binding protein [Candidimonas nitroreducens]OWT65762.1 LacI family transcriptional regulator [Candidimonas nitroreducens]